ncbi:MAG TPA: hypothetical protein VE890_15490 [Thermoguttaceae bacterium]|nr:hypothetical protein [Thermoguttaceae bacterium]
MKIARLVICGVVLTLLVGATAQAEGWSLAKLNPLAGEEPTERSPYAYPALSKEPSALQKFNEGAKKLATDTSAGTKRLVQNTTEGTKKFFVGAKDLLTWKSSSTSTRPVSPYQYLKPEPPPSKPSWFTSLFRREEPKPASSLEEFMSLPRLDP